MPGYAEGQMEKLKTLIGLKKSGTLLGESQKHQR